MVNRSRCAEPVGDVQTGRHAFGGHALPADGHRSGRLAGILAAGAVLVVTLAAYVRTLLPGTVGGDAGEIQYSARLLGLMHSTGLPLYLVIGHVWSSLLPLGSVAYRMNLLSAVSASLACATVAWSAGRLYGRAIGMACGLTLGFGAVFWGQAVIADKYAFNALLSALLCGLACIYAFCETPRKRDRLLYLLSVTYGLCLLHHRTMVLFAPGLMLLVLCGERARLWRRPLRTVACLAFAIGLPAAVYALALPWLAQRPGSPIEWRPETVGGWLAWLEYGEAVAESLGTHGIPARLLTYGHYLVRDYTLAYVLLAAAGLVAMARERRLAALFLGVSYLLQGGLAANSQNSARPYTFYIPSFIVLAFAYGQGLHLAWRWVAPRLRALGATPRWIGTGTAIAAILSLPAYEFATAYPARLLDTRYGEPLGLWRDVIKSADMAERLAAGMHDLPPGAVVVSDWEQLTVLWYKQQVEGWRPDVLLVYPIERLGQHLGGERTVCLSRGLPVPEGWHVSNVGALACLQREATTDLRDGTTPVGAVLQTEDGRSVLELAGYRIAATTVARGRQLPLSVIWRAVDVIGADYSLSLRLLDDGGSQVWQYDAQHPVLGMYPTSRWQVGEVVEDYYEIDVAPTLPPGRYRWAVVLYRQLADGGFAHLRDAVGEHVIVGSELLVTE